MGILANVTRGTLGLRPLRLLVYGVEGIGKSTLAAGAKAPVFLDADDGTAQLNVSRIRIASWPQLREALDALEREQHNFKSAVLDTIDAFDRMLVAAICDQHGVASIEDVGGGYGKGYTALAEQWVAILDQLRRLQERRGMNVIALAQAEIATFRNPNGNDWQRWTLRCQKKTAALWKEWVEVMLFATREVQVATKGREKGKGQGGRRILYTEWAPGREAKNRLGLPAVLPLEWRAFVTAAAAGLGGKPERSLDVAEPGEAPVAEPEQQGGGESAEGTPETATPATGSPPPAAEPSLSAESERAPQAAAETFLDEFAGPAAPSSPDPAPVAPFEAALLDRLALRQRLVACGLPEEVARPLAELDPENVVPVELTRAVAAAVRARAGATSTARWTAQGVTNANMATAKASAVRAVVLSLEQGVAS